MQVVVANSATVTPLASIIGSGFLISGPLLAREFGGAAFWAMAVLLLLAYAVGAGAGAWAATAWRRASLLARASCAAAGLCTVATGRRAPQSSSPNE